MGAETRKLLYMYRNEKQYTNDSPPQIEKPNTPGTKKITTSNQATSIKLPCANATCGRGDGSSCEIRLFSY